MTDAVWMDWWVVAWRQRLVHIEADDAGDAVQGSIKVLRGLGDWTEDPRELRAFPYTEMGKYRRPRDFTRAVIDRERRTRRPHRRAGGNRSPGTVRTRTDKPSV